MKILLTGGSGFIGRNFCEDYNNKYFVVIPTHNELNLLDFQQVQQFIQKYRITHIIHTAIKGDDDVLETTLRMFVNILNVKGTLRKIIHLGSGAEYDKTRDLIKVKENDFGRFIPNDPYGFAKFCCSLMSKKDKRIITLRLFGVYGKYEDYRYKFISNAIVKNLLGIPIVIKQDVVFDYLYIKDLVRIINHFLVNSPKYSEYNITPNKSISLSEITNIINNISQHKTLISIINPGINYQYTADNSRLKKEIPGIKFTSYHEGIKLLYSYYNKRLNSLDKKEIKEDEYLKISKIRSYGDH